MPISSRIRRHLRGNVIAYLALFVALGGSAIALPGKKTVKGNDLANGAVKTRVIGDGKVTESKLAPGSVNAAKLVDGAVQQGKLANAAVTSPKLADSAVVRAKIAQGEVTGGKIDVAAVSTPKLAGDSVTTAKVAPGTLEASDFAAGQLSDGFVFTDTADLTGTAAAAFPATPHAYNAPRAGRLLLSATTTATITCVAACDRKIALFVDGSSTPVPGSTVVVSGGAGDTVVRDLTSTGLVAVGAGAHTVQARFVDSAPTVTGGFENNSISGVLLQS